MPGPWGWPNPPAPQSDIAAILGSVGVQTDDIADVYPRANQPGYASSSISLLTQPLTIRGAVPNHLFIVDNSSVAPASAAGKMIYLTPIAGALDITIQHDYSSDTTGNITQDSVDIKHFSAGDAVFVSHHGGYMGAHLTTGSVATNDGIIWIANQGLSGAAQNAVQVQYLVAGNNTPLTVTGAGSLVTINIATDGGGNPTSTAAQIIAACLTSFNVNSIARAYPAISSDVNGNPVLSTGTGIVGAMAARNLSGAFTGTGLGAMTAFNCWEPLFNDDNAGGQGTVLSYKQGAHGFAVQQLNIFNQNAAMQLANRGAGPCIKLTNQATTQAGSAPSSPADGAGMAFQLIDFSTADTINITRNTVPVGQSATNFPTSKGAVITISHATGTSTYPSIVGFRSGDSLGYRINNDGTATFGKNGNPTAGKVWIEGTNVGAVQQILGLNNTDNTAGAGVAIMFEAANSEHARIYSQLNDATNSQLSLRILAANANVIPLILGSPTGATGVKATWLDALNFAFGTGTGTKIGTSTLQKMAFWNSTPVVQQVLATGAAHTVDDVITLLQTLGLCRQA